MLVKEKDVTKVKNHLGRLFKYRDEMKNSAFLTGY